MEKEGTIFEFETIIKDLEIDTTVHEELIREVLEVYEKFKARNDAETARYLTIAYMVRRLSVKDLPMNKERKTTSKRIEKKVEE